MDNNAKSMLAYPDVQEIPRTPPLTKWGGEFENGWEYFFEDLNFFLQQGISVQKAGELYVGRVGAVVTVTGHIKVGESVNVGVSPVVAFTSENVSIDQDGTVTSTVEKDFSLSFIAR